MQSFLQLLADLRDGGFIDEAQRAIAEVEEAVGDTGKAGRVTITLDLEPVKGGMAAMVAVADTITTKIPKRDRDKTLMYRAGDGRFSRRDPRQPDLPAFRDVNAGRSVGDAAEEAIIG